jgi:hypothetical protein
MKKWASKCSGKIVRHGARGYRIGKVGSVKQKSYCARSLGITRKFPSARKPCSRNYLSRRKWKCPLSRLER